MIQARKLLLSAVLILAMTAPALCRQADARNASRTVIEIGAEDDAGPWSHKDGSGYANDVVKAAFQAVGIEVRFQVLPYARCKQQAEEGRLVACFSMSPVRGEEAMISLSRQPLFLCNAEYFQSAARPLKARRPEELPHGSVIGVVLRYEYPETLYRLQKEGAIVLSEAPSEEINLRKLAEGRIDAAIVNVNEMKTADYMIAAAGVKGKVQPAFRSEDLRSYIGFSRKHPLGLEMQAKFDNGFAIITSNGTLKHIQQVWTERARVEAASSTVPSAREH